MFIRAGEFIRINMVSLKKNTVWEGNQDLLTTSCHQTFRSETFSQNDNNTVKHDYVTTCIKGSPVLSSHNFWFLEPKYSANEPVLRGHLS